MNAQHTPGPRKAECEDKQSWSIRSDDYGGIASLHDPYANDVGRYAQLGANAKLISASPDLLDALQKIVAVIERSPHRECPAAALQLAKAAIAKAESQ